MNGYFFNLKKLSVSKFIFLIYFLFSTAYLAKVTSFSPVYFIYILSIIISVFYFFKYPRFVLKTDVCIVFLLAVYMLITQLSGFKTGEFINIFISLFSYISIRIMSKRLDLDFVLSVFLFVFKVNVIVLGLDSMYRILNPTAPTIEHENILKDSEDLYFYLYKFNTLMFADSNTTALIALIFLTTLLVLKVKSIDFNFSYVWFFLMVVILISTLSRAAIFAFFLFLLFYYIRKFNLYITIAICFVSLFILSFLFFLYGDFILADGSFKSKVKIISDFFDLFFEKSNLVILFGMGFDKYNELLGYSTHLLFLNILASTGLVGFLIYLTFFLYYSIRFSFVFFIPVLLVGLSYFLYVGSPFLFTPLAFIASITELTRDERKKLYIRNNASL